MSSAAGSEARAQSGQIVSWNCRIPAKSVSFLCLKILGQKFMAVAPKRRKKRQPRRKPRQLLRRSHRRRRRYPVREDFVRLGRNFLIAILGGTLFYLLLILLGN